ncbi:MAG: hypothetical protein QXL15_02460 [Candidatus Korarchaeota archaeon]
MNDIENFLAEAKRVISMEHEQMPKKCPKCGGPMKFAYQCLIDDQEPGDIIIYKCTVCGEEVSKFFKFPESYAKRFKKK